MTSCWIVVTLSKLQLKMSSVAGGNRRLQPKGQLTFSLSPCLETINNVWEKWLCCVDPYVADVLCSHGEVGWSAAARGVSSCFFSPPLEFPSDLFRSRAFSFGRPRHAVRSCYFCLPIILNIYLVTVFMQRQQTNKDAHLIIEVFRERFPCRKQEWAYYCPPCTEHCCTSTRSHAPPEACSRRRISIQTCTIFNELCQAVEDKGFDFASLINHFSLLCLRSWHPLAFKSWIGCFCLAHCPAVDNSFIAINIASMSYLKDKYCQSGGGLHPHYWHQQTFM